MGDLSAIFLPLLHTPEFREVLRSVLAEQSQQSQDLPEPDECGLDEARALLGVPGKPISKPFVYRETSRGRMPFKKRGNRLVFSRKELQAWKAAYTREPEFQGESVYQDITASARKKLRK
jgi:hypothetical protein